MSFDFDGVDDRISLGSPTVLDNAEPFSALIWMAPDGLGEGASGRVFAKESGGAIAGGWFLTIGTAAAGQAPRLLFRKDYATTDLEVQTIPGAVRTDGSMQHVALTWDGSATASNARIYLNGVESAYAVQTNGAGAKQSDAALALVIGNRDERSRTFDGRLEHFHFFRRVLSAGEIQFAMRYPMAIGPAASGAASTSGCVAYLPLDAPGAGLALDYSGLELDGTITSAVSHTQRAPINEPFGPQGGGAP